MQKIYLNCAYFEGGIGHNNIIYYKDRNAKSKKLIWLQPFYEEKWKGNYDLLSMEPWATPKKLQVDVAMPSAPSF